jgi:signal transduction histidine kinase
MYAIASRLQSPADQLEALQKLIRLSPPKDLKHYFARYQHLNDSLQTARNAAKNQFALVRYETQKSKTDNLRLQRENAETKAEVVQQRAISAAVIALSMVLTGAGIWWYRKRKQKLEWANERAKQEERLQISQKVHDVVANGIYRLLTAVEHGGNMEREKLLDQLDGLYIQSRDISYEPAIVAGGDFHARVVNILLPYGATGRKVLITGNEESVWKGVGLKVTNELEPILQELMVNMDKHSGAQNVVIRFDRERKGLIVQYIDDGIGFPTEHHLGNGLTNTGNRIAAMGGRISFERNTPSGVKIRIYFPND